MASGAAFGLPLCAVALLLARAFGSAAARYRVYAAAFAAAALYVPLALFLSLVRPATVVLLDDASERFVAAHDSRAAVAIVGIVAIALLGGLVLDLIALMRIKHGARIDARFARTVRNATVASSTRVETPTAIGYVHPRIVVPRDLLARVSPSELEAIIAHEGAHLARFDDWAKAVQTAVARLLWFAPALWMLAARLDLERELASDERVLGAAVDPRAYASCLVRLAAEVRRPLPTPAAWIGRSQVAVRVERLLRPRPQVGRWGAVCRVGALGLAIVAIGGAAVLAVPGPRPVVTVASARASHAALPGKSLAFGAAIRAIRPAARKLAVDIPVVKRAVRPVTAASARPVRRKALPDATQVALGPSDRNCRTCVYFRRPFEFWPAAPATRLAPHRTPGVTLPPSFLAPADILEVTSGPKRVPDLFVGKRSCGSNMRCLREGSLFGGTASLSKPF